jgi:DNA-binding XRE family transcriptional regulator
MATKGPNFLLKEARENIGKTQAEIADLLGVPTSTYYGWEHGDHVPLLRFRLKLAGILQISMMELKAILFGNDGPSSGTMTH